MTRATHLSIAVLVAACVGDNTPPARPTVATWTLDSVPLTDIGATGNARDDIGIVAGATRLPDGRVVVADRSAQALRYFSPNGKQTQRVGGSGRGPGEFTTLTRMLRCGDSLVTYDFAGERYQSFSANGRFARAFRFQLQSDGAPPDALACNGEGRFIANAIGWGIRATIPEGLFRPTVPYWIADANGARLAELGAFPGSTRLGITPRPGRGSGSIPFPLGTASLVAIGRTTAFIATADSSVIDVFALDGTRRGAIRAPLAARPLTQSDVDRFLNGLEEHDDPSRRMRTLFSSIEYPRYLPPFVALLVDADGRLWAQRYAAATDSSVQWLVFTSDGSPVATLGAPADLRLLEIGRDYALAVFTDHEGRERVQVFALHAGS